MASKTVSYITDSYIKVPTGEKITVNTDNTLNVPINPIIPFIEGDGIGVDITPPMQKVVDAAVNKAYKPRPDRVSDAGNKQMGARVAAGLLSQECAHQRQRCRKPSIFAIFIFTVGIHSFFTSKYLHPSDFPLTFVCFIHGRIHHLLHGRRNVYSYAIALNKWDNGIVRHIKCVICVYGDFFTSRHFNI